MSRDTLKAKLEIIRNEKSQGANTAERVGGAMVEILDEINRAYDHMPEITVDFRTTTFSQVGIYEGATVFVDNATYLPFIKLGGRGAQSFESYEVRENFCDEPVYPSFLSEKIAVVEGETLFFKACGKGSESITIHYFDEDGELMVGDDESIICGKVAEKVVPTGAHTLDIECTSTDSQLYVKKIFLYRCYSAFTYGDIVRYSKGEWTKIYHTLGKYIYVRKHTRLYDPHTKRWGYKKIFTAPYEKVERLLKVKPHHTRKTDGNAINAHISEAAFTSIGGANEDFLYFTRYGSASMSEAARDAGYHRGRKTKWIRCEHLRKGDEYDFHRNGLSHNPFTDADGVVYTRQYVKLRAYDNTKIRKCEPLELRLEYKTYVSEDSEMRYTSLSIAE